MVELAKACGLSQTSILRYMKDGSIESDYHYGDAGKREIHLFTETRVLKYKGGQWE